jgi:hypothetical protein
MHGKSDPWTEEETALLRELATTGRSARQISSRIPGKSRNAVIGKLGRLGLSTEQLRFWNPDRRKRLQDLYYSAQGYTWDEMAEMVGCSRLAVRDELARMRRRTGLSIRPQKRVSIRTNLPVATPAQILKPSPAPKRVAKDAIPRKLKFLELQYGHCRYILDEGDEPANMDSVYCGADTVESGSWCGPHRRVVFQPR